MIVECTSVSDIEAVLHEGLKNRKQGSHELNKDSSRSHSVLTAYLIGEVSTGGQIIKVHINNLTIIYKSDMESSLSLIWLVLSV